MNPWLAASASAILTLVGKIIFDWLAGKRVNGNSAGGKRFREIIEDVMTHRNDKLRIIMREEIREQLAMYKGRR